MRGFAIAPTKLGVQVPSPPLGNTILVDIDSRDALDAIRHWNEYAETLMPVFDRNGDGDRDEGDG
jgi:hypothetical protein